MTKYFKIAIIVFVSFLVITCNNKENAKTNKETILKGETTILVDETLKPVIEDQVQVFESYYDAKINIDAKSEAELIQSLVKDTARIAILSRELTKEEAQFFANKKITPKTTPFAKDAIAFITNQSNNDTLIAIQEVIDYLQGKTNSKIKGLVFDNPNSSTATYFKKLASIDILPSNGVFSFKTNEEVIKYVADNNGMIGIIGINHIFEPSRQIEQYLDRVNVLDVKNTKDNIYYSPSQDNIASGNYPLARDLYIINCQGFSGLGMGFASFIAGEIGQRIILKSGLVPVRVPSRKILVTKNVNIDKK